MIIYYSAMRTQENLPFATTWIDLEGFMLSEVKSNGERQILYDIIYIWNQEKFDSLWWIKS